MIFTILLILTDVVIFYFIWEERKRVKEAIEQREIAIKQLDELRDWVARMEKEGY